MFGYSHSTFNLHRYAENFESNEINAEIQPNEFQKVLTNDSQF